MTFANIMQLRHLTLVVKAGDDSWAVRLRLFWLVLGAVAVAFLWTQ
jgi:hypothetical protein